MWTYNANTDSLDHPDGRSVPYFDLVSSRCLDPFLHGVCSYEAALDAAYAKMHPSTLPTTAYPIPTLSGDVNWLPVNVNLNELFASALNPGVISSATHSCTEHLATYVGITHMFKYCRICDSKVRE